MWFSSTLSVRILKPARTAKESGRSTGYELAGEGYKTLALVEEQKAMPWQAVYDMFCLKNNVPVGDAFIAEIDKYVADVTSKR